MGESLPDLIIVLVPGFPADDRDTACIPAVQTYVAALSAAHEVRVLAFQYPYRTGNYTWQGIAVYSAGGRNLPGSAKLRTWARILRQLFSMRSRKSIVHSFWIGECALIGYVASRVFGWSHVVTVGGQEISRPTRYSRVLRWSGALSRAVLTAGSDHAARSAASVLRRSVDAVIPLGLDSLPPSAARDRDIDVLGVGSLIPLKRFDEFLDVASVLAKRHPDISMVLVGDGPDRGKLRRRINSTSLRRNLRLAGQIPREEVLELMMRSKILLHPSEYESQGYVFLEALASGMYVVCRDVGAPGASRKVSRCSTTREMADVIHRLLLTEMDHEPESVPSAADSVEAYGKIYRHAHSRIFGTTSHRS